MKTIKNFKINSILTLMFLVLAAVMFLLELYVEAGIMLCLAIITILMNIEINSYHIRIMLEVLYEKETYKELKRAKDELGSITEALDATEEELNTLLQAQADIQQKTDKVIAETLCNCDECSVPCELAEEAKPKRKYTRRKKETAEESEVKDTEENASSEPKKRRGRPKKNA